MWLSWELLGLAMPAVDCTALWRTQTAIDGECRMVDGGAKPDRISSGNSVLISTGNPKCLHTADRSVTERSASSGLLAILQK